MGLIRLIIFGLIVWLVWRLVKNKLLENGEKSGKTRQQDYGRMVRCSYCDTHLPESQAVQDANQWYCSQDHKNKAQK